VLRSGAIGVDVECRRRVAVAEPAGDGADVDAGAEELTLTGDEAPEIVSADVGQTLLDAQPLEAA
jgi:hypothetical protein